MKAGSAAMKSVGRVGGRKFWISMTGAPFDNNGVSTRQVRKARGFKNAMAELKSKPGVWNAVGPKGRKVHGAWAGGATRRRARALAREMAK